MEQEAMRFLQKGQTDRAIEKYVAILRDNPRDRRLRQKIADLYFSVGRHKEAENHYRAVARTMSKGGHHRQAATIYEKLLGIKKDDIELKGLYADAQLAAGYPAKAKDTYLGLVEALKKNFPDEAVPFILKLIKLEPGHFPYKVQYAELLEAAAQTNPAYLEWRSLAGESRRLGRTDDRAKFLEFALRLKSDQAEVALEAADARLALGDVNRALRHIRTAYEADVSTPATLDLLGRALERLSLRESARQVWVQLAEVRRAAGDAPGQADALRHALSCGEDDPAIVALLGDADRAAERLNMRLTAQPWAMPVNEVAATAVVRAEIQDRYGFPELARETLGAAGDSLGVQVALAEMLVKTSEHDAAVALLESLRPTGQAAQDISVRIAVIQGRPELESGADLLDELVDEPWGDDDDDLFDDDDLGAGADLGDDLDDDDLEDFEDDLDDDEDLEDDPTDMGESDEEEGDRLSAAGDLAGAMSAYRRVLGADPTNESALMKLGELMSAADDARPAPAPSVASDEDAFDFDDDSAFDFDDDPGFGDLLDTPASAPTPAPVAAPAPARRAASAPSSELADARAWLMVGRADATLAALDEPETLEAGILAARAHCLSGDPRAAVSVLRDVLDEAQESDPRFAEAVFELARCYARRGKVRAARRSLDELDDLDDAAAVPAEDVASLARGLELLGR